MLSLVYDLFDMSISKNITITLHSYCRKSVKIYKVVKESCSIHNCGTIFRSRLEPIDFPEQLMRTSACDGRMGMGHSRYFIFSTVKHYGSFTDLGQGTALLRLEGSRTGISTSTSWNSVKLRWFKSVCKTVGTCHC